MIGYRHEYGRQHIESLEFIAQYEVQPYRHDYCVADIAYLPEHLALQQPAERARKQRDAALIDEQRYERNITPNPSVAPKIIAETKSIVLLTKSTELSPVRPSFIEPIIAIAPMQRAGCR